MAGKTLTGIGEDESGRHEAARETSDSAIRAVGSKTINSSDKPQSARPTDPMPLFAASSGGPSVDEDKVAEGLKKLRSLDEPLGPIPTSMPTLKDGIPAVGGHPTPVSPATAAVAAAAELLRSRGTAHGHALSAAAGQASLPVSVDDRMKGTLLGHSLHLPDLPEVPEENRPAEIRAIARTAAPGAFVPESIHTDFSHGDSHFFDSDPVNNEFEPENPRSKIMVRGAIFVAVVSVFVVAAIAWVRVRKPDTPPPIEAHVTPPAPPAPSALDNPNGAPAVAPSAPAAGEVPPSTAAPAAAATAPAAGPAPAAAAPPPPVAAVPEAVPEEEARSAVAPTPPPEPPRAHARRREPPVLPAPKPSAPQHAARPAAPPHETSKPAATGKRAKDEDPDGTLPLSE
jgi:hypothetical protein